MLKYYVKASDLLKRLREDKDGVVSFEWIMSRPASSAPSLLRSARALAALSGPR